MPATFARDSMAAFYAKRHKETDPAIAEVHYLPTSAPRNEIRLVDVNRSITSTAHPEPVDFGVNGGTDDEHKLIVLDVTPQQWREIRESTLALPRGWSLEHGQEIGGHRPRKR